MRKTIKNRTLELFGNSIRTHRKRKGLSQEKLALECGLDRTYLGSVERGERNISLLNIAKIARALGIKLSKLFSNIDI